LTDVTESGLTVFDLVGVGFGPSNLALAVAVEEANASTTRASPALHARFFERQPKFGWHRGMLIDDATMQVSFLKDLVTLRNPASDYSFVSYLHQQGRLVDFINLKTLFPLRTEFHGYLEWAADRLGQLVEYDREVVNLRPVWREGAVVAVDVDVRRAGCSHEHLRTYRARNVVLGVGLEPYLPDGAELADAVWHSSELLGRIGAWEADGKRPARLLVVGAGQSAAEVVEYVHRRFPAAEVGAIFSRFGYSVADDTPFANRVCDPEAVDVYFDAPASIRARLFSYHRNTNYSVVDAELIEELYGRVYQESVEGRPRLRMMNTSRVVSVRARPPGVEVTVENLSSGDCRPLVADALIYATGYRPVDPGLVLGEAAELCCRDEDGLLRVGRDYRVSMRYPLSGGIYLQGGTEHTHGITSSLLSNAAVRAGEILHSLLDRSQSQEALFLDTSGIFF
jgi:L-ornithine N5-oxygenase